MHRLHSPRQHQCDACPLAFELPRVQKAPKTGSSVFPRAIIPDQRAQWVRPSVQNYVSGSGAPAASGRARAGQSPPLPRSTRRGALTVGQRVGSLPQAGLISGGSVGNSIVDDFGFSARRIGLPHEHGNAPLRGRSRSLNRPSPPRRDFSHPGQFQFLEPDVRRHPGGHASITRLNPSARIANQSISNN